MSDQEERSQIVRAPRPEQNFTIVDNNVIDDRRLSWRALGVLVWVLRQVDHWRIDAQVMSNMRPAGEGRDAIKAALRELDNAGYVVRTKRRTSKGYWVTDTVIYDRPQGIVAGQNQDGFPGVGKPGVGNPGAVVRTHIKSSLESGERDRSPAEMELAQALCDLLAQQILDVTGRTMVFPAVDASYLQRNLLVERALDPSLVDEVICWAMTQPYWSVQLTTVQRLVTSWGQIFSQYTKATAPRTPRRKGGKLTLVAGGSNGPDALDQQIEDALRLEVPRHDDRADHWYMELTKAAGPGRATILEAWRAEGREDFVEAMDETLNAPIANVF